MTALYTGEVHRIVFPNYFDYLYFQTLPEYKIMADEFSLTNTLDYPLQIGMAVAVETSNMTTMEESFLKCFRNQLPSMEKQVKCIVLAYSENFAIVFNRKFRISF